MRLRPGRCHAGAARGAGGARRFRRRYQQPQHQARARRRPLPGAGDQEHGPDPVPAGPGGAARAQGAHGACPAPGPGAGDLRPPLSAQPSALLPHRSHPVRPPGRRVRPAPVGIHPTRGGDRPVSPSARALRRPGEAAADLGRGGLPRRPVRRRPHEHGAGADRGSARRGAGELRRGRGPAQEPLRPHHRCSGVRPHHGSGLGDPRPRGHQRGGAVRGRGPADGLHGGRAAAQGVSRQSPGAGAEISRRRHGAPHTPHGGWPGDLRAAMGRSHPGRHDRGRSRGFPRIRCRERRSWPT